MFEQSATVPLWVNGEEKSSSSTFEVISPIDQKKLYSCSGAGEEEVEATISAAEQALESWSQTKPEERRRNRGILEQGDWGPASMFAFEVGLAIAMLRDVAGKISAASTGLLPVVSQPGQSAMLVKEPYGVVLGIAPWNAPCILGMRAFVQPLAMGNTVIIKGPEAAPGVYWALSSVMHEAGLPKGVLNTIYHRPADASKITTALIAHPAVKKINFTGSTNVGAIIASLAGKYLKPTVMELGGKAPSIVCEDADVQTAALQVSLGSFLHAGQICMATERILVHKNIVDKFRPALKATMDKLQPELGVPQLVTAAPVEKNKKLISDAVSKGAGVLYGDAKANEESKTKMRPVIVENVTEKMDIYHTESFGPTVSLFVVESDEEAIKIANDTDYGLSSAVFTGDLRRGLKIAKQIETGAVHINSMTVHDEANLPHGGVKKSGFGRFNSAAGLEEWTRSKVITWND
ncbi:Vanillin dehydrogenase [Cyphellophora attinorum]|uniref:Vanillin dehydrogenase n=1 Tax=Cyphellophora attinorum TaxID=1664694 RepID=A0A0N1HME4_9EURO|nr:Vanillin dehydrogenase [Phialophora attinorum]KPI35916.1 Vanillin dehydrogenase [Phialophora attinorum]